MKKFLSVLLVLCMVLTLLPMAAMAAEEQFTDMPDNYAAPALRAAVANGLLNGSDGKLMPNANLTRAQMAAVVNRAFGAAEKSDISAYTDVPSGAWYAGDMAAAVHMKTFMGSGSKLMPMSDITRQEAFSVLARALNMPAGDQTVLAKFNDGAKVASRARDSVSAMISAGFVNGSGSMLNPTANITRADFAVVMNNIIKTYISKAGEYSTDYTGSVMINVPDVTLKNITITGDLIIGDGVGDGNVTLDNVKVTGRTIVRGGGVHSIIIKGASQLGTVTIAKVDGNVRVNVEGGASVQVVEINDGKDDVLVEGTVGEVKVESGEVPVTVQNATVEKVTVNAEKANVTVAKDAVVKEVTVAQSAKGAELSVAGTVTTINSSAPQSKVTAAETAKVDTVNVEKTAAGTSVDTSKGATVGTVNAGADGTAVTGTGTVKNANVTGNNSSVDTVGTTTKVSEGVTGATSNGNNMQSGATSTTTETKPEIKPETPTTGGGTVITPVGPTANDVAQVTVLNGVTSYYTTVKAAMEAANNSTEQAEVTLLKDAKLTEDCSFKGTQASGTDLVIPEGKTLEITDSVTFTNDESVIIDGALTKNANATITGIGCFCVKTESNLHSIMDAYTPVTTGSYRCRINISDSMTLTKDLTVKANTKLICNSDVTIPTGKTVTVEQSGMLQNLAGLTVYGTVKSNGWYMNYSGTTDVKAGGKLIASENGTRIDIMSGTLQLAAANCIQVESGSCINVDARYYGGPAAAAKLVIGDSIFVGGKTDNAVFKLDNSNNNSELCIRNDSSRMNFVIYGSVIYNGTAITGIGSYDMTVNQDGILTISGEYTLPEGSNLNISNGALAMVLNGSMSVSGTSKININGSDTENVAAGNLSIAGTLNIGSWNNVVFGTGSQRNGVLFVTAFTNSGRTLNGTLINHENNATTTIAGGKDNNDAYFQLDGTGEKVSTIVFMADTGTGAAAGRSITVFAAGNSPCEVTLNKDLAMGGHVLAVTNGATLNLKAKLSAGNYVVENGGTIKLIAAAGSMDTTGMLTGTLAANGGTILAPADNTGNNYIAIVGPNDSTGYTAYKTNNAVFKMESNSMEIYSGTVTLGMDFNTASGMTLTLDGGATFTIPAGKTLYVYGPVVNNGTLNGEAGAKLVIEPGVTVSGSASSGLASNSTASAVTYTWSGSAWTSATT